MTPPQCPGDVPRPSPLEEFLTPVADFEGLPAALIFNEILTSTFIDHYLLHRDLVMICLSPVVFVAGLCPFSAGLLSLLPVGPWVAQVALSLPLACHVL